MSGGALRAWLAVLVVIGATAGGGWVLGAAGLASEPDPGDPVVVSPPTPEPHGGATASLVLPRVGLSPFGQHGGLPGRQVLVGRVVSVEGDAVTVALSLGNAVFTFTQSSFLLRLQTGAPADAAPGAAVAVLLAGDTADPTATHLLVLPQANRPQVLNTPLEDAGS